MVSIPLGIVCGLAPRAARTLPSALAAIAAAASAITLAAGVGSGMAPYPWTNIPVLVFALAGGLILGRAIPARATPMALLLGVLAIFDAVQLVVPGPSTAVDGGARPPWWFYSMFALDLFGGWKAVGIFDLLLLTAIGEHWRRRGGSPLVSVIPGIAGFVLVSLVVTFMRGGGLPLVPFIAVGWFLSELAYRRRPPGEPWPAVSGVSGEVRRR